MGLTQGALAASKLGIDEAIGRAIDQMNMGEIDLLNPGFHQATLQRAVERALL